MSEHDIAKHTKEIYRAWTAPNRKWKHKLLDVLVEIFIIVFAITLSLLVERWREQLRDKKIEKQFLLGLKKDLQNDLVQLTGDSTTYVRVANGYEYFRSVVDNKQPLSQDSTRKYADVMTSSADFIPNDSRFEALKSSAELGVIEDDSLLNIILDLYQNRIRALQMGTSIFTRFQLEQMTPFLQENARINSDGVILNTEELLKTPKLQNYLLFKNSIPGILNRYHAVMGQSREIIDMINRQYQSANVEM